MSSEVLKPRFRRGVRSITKFYNEHAAEPVTVPHMFKIIARGTIPTGRDGRRIIAEESAILDALRQATSIRAP